MKIIEKDMSHLVEDYWDIENFDNEILLYRHLCKDSPENIDFLPEPYRTIFTKHYNATPEKLAVLYPEHFL